MKITETSGDGGDPTPESQPQQGRLQNKRRNDDDSVAEMDRCPLPKEITIESEKNQQLYQKLPCIGDNLSNGYRETGKINLGKQVCVGREDI